MALLYTTPVSLEDLPDDDMLRLTPGIFQPEIPKAYELRVTYMGGFAVTAKLLSQINPETKLDWRMSCPAIPIEPAQLPIQVDRACRRLMKRLGTVFGCFDFIVTPDGEYVFLEMNEMGQFLWIEDLNPDFKLLDCFCEFLVRRSPEEFHWQPSANCVTLHDFRDLAIQQKQAEANLHVHKPNFHLVDDNERIAPAF